jgi:small subunit ribosomal protein S27Ae
MAKDKKLEKKGEIGEKPKEEAKEIKEKERKGEEKTKEELKKEEKEKKKKEKKSQKERPKSVKKHTKVQIWKLYKVDGDKLIRKNENCPRCGAGTFLAIYKNRKYCGKCGWGQIS